uniref:Uncharacterized protein n=1 Tax=Solanum tuberosum TaxID=4113 RepID=M1DN96_SOLTU
MLDVISMKLETIKDVHTGDMVASIEEIKETNSEQAVPRSIYADGDLYGESIEEDVWKVEISNQSSAISRSVIGLDQILEANGDDEYQIEEEVDIEVSETNKMLFESSEAAKISIEEMVREYGSRFYVSVETLQEIDSVSLDKIIVKKLRERGSLKTLQGDNLHGLTDDEESLSFEEARGARKKLLRFLPRCGSKLR